MPSRLKMRSRQSRYRMPSRGPRNLLPTARGLTLGHLKRGTAELLRRKMLVNAHQNENGRSLVGNRQLSLQNIVVSH